MACAALGAGLLKGQAPLPRQHPVGDSPLAVASSFVDSANQATSRGPSMAWAALGVRPISAVGQPSQCSTEPKPGPLAATSVVKWKTTHSFQV